MRSRTTGNNQTERIIHLFQTYTATHSAENEPDDVAFLVQLVNIFRPKKDFQLFNRIDISPLLEVLLSNEGYRNYFSSYLRKTLYKKEFDTIITDVGIIKDSDFSYEIKKRLVGKILPIQPQKNTLQFILNQVFDRSSDPQWLKKVPIYQIEELMKIIGLGNIYQSSKKHFEIAEILYGSEVLLHRISGKVMETEVNRMVPEYQNLDSPFIALQREFIELSEQISNSDKKYITPDNLHYKQLLILLKQCENYIETAFNNSHKFGISLKANQSLLRIRQQLERLKVMLDFLILESEDRAGEKTILLSWQLIQYNCGRTNISKLIRDSTQSISYEITQHTAKTGEHYITSSRKEYYRMFWTASGGGLIVAFLCVFKILLGKVEASGFGHAFYYSMNYSLGFIAIYLCGFTLATKQPAMTASALASALENGKHNKNISAEDKYTTFARLFARVFRSQFIAFAGNVMIAFPVAMLLIWGIDKIFHYNIAEQKFYFLLTDLSPVHSPAIFHAAIAGFFLFISGIIAGSIANRDKFNHIYYRIQEHPALKRLLGKNRTYKLAKAYEKKGAGILSNFWFGVFMGSTSSIGIFLGLNLDIRHITFASGNLALGLYGGHFDLPASIIVWGIFGIGVIGFVNFIVSFSLSLSLALRSRNISFLELKSIAASIWKHFKQYPMSFFYPTRSSQ